MKIGLDTSYVGLSGNPRGGAYQYIVNLTQAILSVDHENEYRLSFNYVRRKHARTLNEVKRLFPGGRCIVRRIPFRSWIPYPAEFYVGRVDVFHGMYESLPPVLECRTVVTVHDSAYKRRPDSLRPEWVQRLGRQIPEAIGRADLVITVSRFTKGDLEEMLGVPEEKIRVIYHGANSAFFRIASEPVEASESVRMAYGIRRPYILYVGVLQPSKNIGGLVEAFARLKARIDIPHRLVIVGARGWMYEDIFVKMQESGVEDVVDFPGEVQDAGGSGPGVLASGGGGRCRRAGRSPFPGGDREGNGACRH
ncbi:hypothetical protein AMJ82_07645 [candidate division TA06 bacterium SM23_40]|uniref:Glycosyltransferase subfamily 4-like N-terminal domain-containing protein n=1 Tax=candidate division TA06 bacterium SM23_40 TaxID=1703774 RepID=A0A0S8G736_UNCT6|nr:MAG: hypothetical protein AMJ82_07645 [candidate division TA06 bacterium SM23_40]